MGSECVWLHSLSLHPVKRVDAIAGLGYDKVWNISLIQASLHPPIVGDVQVIVACKLFTCLANMSWSHVLVTCFGHMFWSHVLVTCFGHMFCRFLWNQQVSMVLYLGFFAGQAVGHAERDILSTDKCILRAYQLYLSLHIDMLTYQTKAR